MYGVPTWRVIYNINIYLDTCILNSILKLIITLLSSNEEGSDDYYAVASLFLLYVYMQGNWCLCQSQPIVKNILLKIVRLRDIDHHDKSHVTLKTTKTT